MSALLLTEGESTPSRTAVGASTSCCGALAGPMGTGTGTGANAIKTRTTAQAAIAKAMVSISCAMGPIRRASRMLSESVGMTLIMAVSGAGSWLQVRRQDCSVRSTGCTPA